MFVGFNIELSAEDILGDSFYSEVLKLFNSQRRSVESSLKKFVCEDGYFDASKLQESWFPQVEADIFLSHSHKDEKLIISFAGCYTRFFI